MKRVAAESCWNCRGDCPALHQCNRPGGPASLAQSPSYRLMSELEAGSLGAAQWCVALEEGPGSWRATWPRPPWVTMVKVLPFPATWFPFL